MPATSTTPPSATPTTVRRGGRPSLPGVGRHLGFARLALTRWTSRQWWAAAASAAGTALLIGLPTVLIPNPVFGREIPVVAWNYPVWLVTSALAGLLAATYVRPRRSPGAGVDEDTSGEGSGDAPSRLGLAGGVLAWFAVGCPVCNKIALLALGYSGALTWFAPAQPVLAVAAVALTAVALVARLSGQVACGTRRG
ncbi:hypothetical protein [Cellulomonas sp. APG4]|uniref:hypothetical protein n=1 Tax=Cellulomonas sp. APG4 TaxID=1538656 RepID=UPI001ED8C1E8|nr:hypothetical protein [Cellulomonas sp. APG4]